MLSQQNLHLLSVFWKTNQLIQTGVNLSLQFVNLNWDSSHLQFYNTCFIKLSFIPEVENPRKVWQLLQQHLLIPVSLEKESGCVLEKKNSDLKLLTAR